MDRAMNQLDIVTYILSCINCKATLASLAQVSHRISELALDELWYEMDSVILLARCMPWDTWDEVEGRVRAWSIGKSFRSYLKLSVEPPEGDWLNNRFRRYAARIRSLCTADHSADHIKWPIRSPLGPEKGGKVIANVVSTMDPEVFRAWRKYSQTIQPLFPNLKSLRWEACSDIDCELIQVFLVPTLIDLALVSDGWIRSGYEDPSLITGRSRSHGPWQEHTLTRILRDVLQPQGCPKLRGLTIHTTLISESGAPSNLASMVHLPLEQIVSFRLTREIVSLDLLQFTSTLICLQELDVLVPENLLGIARTSSPMFPALRHLQLRAATVRFMLTLLADISSTSLLTLKLDTVHRLRMPDLVKFLQCVNTHPSASILKILEISEARYLSPVQRMQWQSTESTSYIAMDEPVLQCHSMISLQHFSLIPIDSHHSPGLLNSLPASIIHSMMGSWPNLETFRAKMTQPTHIPLLDFVRLARGCPSLKTIDGVTADFSISDCPQLAGTDSWQHRQLAHMSFLETGACVTTSDCAPMAHYLKTTFPNIADKQIRASGPMKLLLFRATMAHRAGVTWSLADFRESARPTLTGLSPLLGNDSVTGHYTEEGKSILCFARVARREMYPSEKDEHEMDIQLGDMIAVTEMERSSASFWWKGELLDGQRHVTGKNTFRKLWVSIDGDNLHP